jgi:hypothetical protein
VFLVYQEERIEVEKKILILGWHSVAEIFI